MKHTFFKFSNNNVPPYTSIIGRADDEVHGIMVGTNSFDQIKPNKKNNYLLAIWLHFVAEQYFKKCAKLQSSPKCNAFQLGKCLLRRHDKMTLIKIIITFSTYLLVCIYYANCCQNSYLSIWPMGLRPDHLLTSYNSII